MKKGAFLLLFGVLGAMLLAGCGGGDGDEETTSLTREQFVTQANKICKRSQLEREDLIAGAQKLVKPGESISESAKEELVITAFADPYKSMLEELKELGLPEKDKQEFEALLKSMEKSERDIRSDPKTAVTSIVQFEDSNEMARKLGLENCAI